MLITLVIYGESKMKMGPLDKLCYLLVVIGGLNLGTVGFFQYNFIFKLLNSGPSRVVYGIIGVAALYLFFQMLVMMSTPAKKSKK